MILCAYPVNILVEPKDVKRLRVQTIIDLRPPSEYKKGHIVGAVNLPIERFLMAKDNIPFQMKDLDTLVKVLSSLGIRQNDPILIYSSAAMPVFYANPARLFFVLEFLGFKNVYILNGGFEAWKRYKLPTSKKKGLRPRRRLKVKPDSSIIATKEFVLKVLGNPEYQIFDVRPIGYYFGVKGQPFYSRYGHIPESIPLPYEFFFERTKDGYYVIKSAEKIDSILKFLVNPNSKYIFYCNTGREASLGYFIFRLMGYDKKKLKVFDGSFAVWSRDTTLPVVRFKW